MIITAGLSEAHVICVKQLIIVYNPYMHGIAWAYSFMDSCEDHRSGVYMQHVNLQAPMLSTTGKLKHGAYL